MLTATEFGKNTFVLHASPAYIEKGREKFILEKMVEDVDAGSTPDKTLLLEKTARSLAQNASIKAGQLLLHKEMKALCENLLLCASPSLSYSGKPVIIKFSKEELAKRFDRK